MAVAVSCCLETELWTLWMADQVSRMASAGVVRTGLLMNLLAWYPRRPVVSRMNGTRVTCGYWSILTFSALLAM